MNDFIDIETHRDLFAKMQLSIDDIDIRMLSDDEPVAWCEFPAHGYLAIDREFASSLFDRTVLERTVTAQSTSHFFFEEDVHAQTIFALKPQWKEALR